MLCCISWFVQNAVGSWLPRPISQTGVSVCVRDTITKQSAIESIVSYANIEAGGANQASKGCRGMEQKSFKANHAIMIPPCTGCTSFL